VALLRAKGLGNYNYFPMTGFRMNTNEYAQLRKEEALTRYAARVGKELDTVAADHGDQTHEMTDSVRKVEHKSHRIVIRTHYAIDIDGSPFVTPVMVDNSGRVSCHALPNYSFLSAIDLVKQLIDTFPDDFSKSRGEKANVLSGMRNAKSTAAKSVSSASAKRRQTGKARPSGKTKRSTPAKRK
jgi:hypothetical protein